MEEIKDFRTTMLEMISSEEIENQKELNEVYVSLVQDYSHLQRTRYIESIPVLTQQDIEKSVKLFLQKPIYTKFLQKKNILLSRRLWLSTMLAHNKIDVKKSMLSIDEEESIVQLSQLSVIKVDSKWTLALRIAEIQVDERSAEELKWLASRMSSNLTKLLSTGNTRNLYALEKLVSKCSKFAIHDYLLPDGYLNDETLQSAVLLFRYERVFVRENETLNSSNNHNNYGLPNYFKKLFPETISHSELVEESHMHFSEGVGSMCRLEDRSERRNRNNLGAGYALPISKLKQYLLKIRKGLFESPEEEDFYMRNDFGMHFLYLRKGELDTVISAIRAVEKSKTPFAEFLNALQLMEDISFTIPKRYKNERGLNTTNIKKPENEDEFELT